MYLVFYCNETIALAPRIYGNFLNSRSRNTNTTMYEYRHSYLLNTATFTTLVEYYSFILDMVIVI